MYEVDLSSPDTPELETIVPGCSSGTSITVISSGVIDNGCNGEVEYQFCRNTTNSTV